MSMAPPVSELLLWLGQWIWQVVAEVVCRNNLQAHCANEKKARQYKAGTVLAEHPSMLKMENQE
jgi:hypothetical protein